MKRFGYAIKAGGDLEIAGALATGIEAGTPERKRLEDDFHQNISEDARRVAMRRHTPEEWAQMTEDARARYGRRRWPLPGILAAALALYALAVYAVSVAFGVLWEAMTK